MKMIRSDKLKINTNSSQRDVLGDTLAYYRKYVRDLMVLINARWKLLQHASGNDCIKLVEELIHPTKYRPVIKHPHFHKNYYKFPSYLRRVAIMDAYGQVSSFYTRYSDWLDSGMKNMPPKLTCATNTYPSLYKGQCVKFSEDNKTAFIKVRMNNDWIWRAFKLSGKSRFLGKGKAMSPLLTLKGKQWALSMPVKIDIPLKDSADFSGRVLAVDMGINSAAVCAVVDKYGTVVHRCFFDRTDKDRIYQIMQRIRNKAKKATRHGSKIPARFCASDHRRLRQLNQNMSHQISRKIVDLAARFDCDGIIIEDLKRWKPKGHGKTMKIKFHNWFKSLLADNIESKSVELGVRTHRVYARGTSSYAYDGSGKLSRDKDNYANAEFSNGKRYNADLNAAYNIAARGIIKIYYPQLRKQMWSRNKPNACPTTGSPLVLSSLWLLEQPKVG
jgi:IS605 OrfB family transposase